MTFLETLKLSQFPENKNWFIFSLLSKWNRSFHAWDPWGSNPKTSLYYQLSVQNKTKRKEENELYPRQNQQSILLTLAGTEIQTRAATYFKRFQGKPVGFNKHTLVGFFFSLPLNSKMQIAQSPFLDLPGAAGISQRYQQYLKWLGTISSEVMKQTPLLLTFVTCRARNV